MGRGQARTTTRRLLFRVRVWPSGQGHAVRAVS